MRACKLFNLLMFLVFDWKFALTDMFSYVISFDANIDFLIKINQDGRRFKIKILFSFIRSLTHGA